jgi:hypothetical protein
MGQDLEDLLRGLGENSPSTDRTVYIRETPNGPVVDFEVIERTSFEHDFPETTKEYHYKQALPCGHQIDNKEHTFGGYCKMCGQEYCASCLLQCKCGKSVSVACCAKLYDTELLCKKCAKHLKRKAILSKIWGIISHPFLAEEPEDE